MKRGNKMPAHLHDKDRQGQERRQDQLSLQQVPFILCAALGLHLCRLCLRQDWIACLTHHIGQIGKGQIGGRGDIGLFHGQIDFGFDHGGMGI